MPTWQPWHCVRVRVGPRRAAADEQLEVHEQQDVHGEGGRGARAAPGGGVARPVEGRLVVAAGQP